MVKAKLYIDGGARPTNPGPAVCSFILFDISNGKTAKLIVAGWHPVGEQTNNYAEYQGLIRGLRAVIENGIDIDILEVLSDSQLLVNQMNGEWKVNDETLRTLRLEARSIGRQIEEISYR